MITKQYLFRMYVEQAAEKDHWYAARFGYPPSLHKTFQAARDNGVRSFRFTRACNFVARQLGLWEER